MPESQVAIIVDTTDGFFVYRDVYGIVAAYNFEELAVWHAPYCESLVLASDEKKSVPGLHSVDGFFEDKGIDELDGWAKPGGLEDARLAAIVDAVLVDVHGHDPCVFCACRRAHDPNSEVVVGDYFVVPEMEAFDWLVGIDGAQELDLSRLRFLEDEDLELPSSDVEHPVAHRELADTLGGEGPHLLVVDKLDNRVSVVNNQRLACEVKNTAVILS